MGIQSFLGKLEDARQEFETEYRKWIQERREVISRQKEAETKQKWDEISKIFKSGSKTSKDISKPCIPNHLVEISENEGDLESASEAEKIDQIMLNPRGKLRLA